MATMKSSTKEQMHEARQRDSPFASGRDSLMLQHDKVLRIFRKDFVPRSRMDVLNVGVWHEATGKIPKASDDFRAVLRISLSDEIAGLRCGVLRPDELGDRQLPSMSNPKLADTAS